MLTVILTCSLLIINVYSLLESGVFNADEIGAYRNYVSIDPAIMKSDSISCSNLNKENSTEICYVLNRDSFPMFNTDTGINLVEYLKEKLYLKEYSTFKYNESLIDIAIIEYHKYLELTKYWINNDNHDKYIYIPSKLIDFVWHWHILQTYEYYLMCNKQFNGIFLHHRPYFGKEVESSIYKNRINKYRKTLIDYKNYFGYYPPNIIWGKQHKYSSADCQMHECDSNMKNADCECDSYNRADCEEMHQCDSLMRADCEEMHQCDSYMRADDIIHLIQE